MDLGLKDKVVVCMSSASGFGKGIATEFAREGAKVVICTSEAFKAELDQAVIDIEKETGNRPHPYMYDVLNNESIAAMINKVAEDLGGIYGLVNHCPGPEGRHLRGADRGRLGGRLSEMPVQLHHRHPRGAALHEAGRRRTHRQLHLVLHQAGAG